jgi:hypothetical protein
MLAGLGAHAYSRGKGNLSHANFVTLLSPPLFLVGQNRGQGIRRKGMTRGVHPLVSTRERKGILPLAVCGLATWAKRPRQVGPAQGEWAGCGHG